MEGNLPAIAKNAVVGYSAGSEKGPVPAMAAMMTVESMEDAGMITAGAGLTEVVVGTTKRDTMKSRRTFVFRERVLAGSYRRGDHAG